MGPRRASESMTRQLERGLLLNLPHRAARSVLQDDAFLLQLDADGVGTLEVLRLAGSVTLRDQRFDLRRVELGIVEMGTLGAFENQARIAATDTGNSRHGGNSGTRRRSAGRVALIEIAVDGADCLEQDADRSRRVQVVIHGG